MELRKCRRDLIHWVNAWLWTYDPRLAAPVVPFDLFPRQAEFLAWLAEREARQEGGLVEKSRDMGVTYLCCAFALHRWLFRPAYSVGFGSRKLELVDRLGDPDSIFEKIRFLLYRLPDWMLPEGFDRREHDNHARLINPETEATVTGEGGDEIGRGGRKGAYFIDEAAFLERPQSVDRALSQTTNVRIDVSTPNGMGNPFYTKRHSGAVPVFTLSWRDDPRKGEAWYEEQKRRCDPVTLAQEVDIDYSASIEGIAIPAAWVRAAVGLQLPAEGPTVAGLDVAEYGPDLNVFIPRRGPVASPPSSWSQTNTTESAWRAKDAAVKAGAVAVAYDAGGPGAGVRGTWDTTEGLPFEGRAVLFGEAAGEDRWPDGQTSHEKFLNVRAEMWWKARVRFEKAYEFVEKKIPHPPEEMISIPDCPQLIAELSMPLAQRTSSGKIKLESKDDMRRRGLKSPNYADALVLAFHAQAPTPIPGWEGVFAFGGPRGRFAGL